jgi:DNA repair exonuclease SbcCD ATPase subunit
MTALTLVTPAAATPAAPASRTALADLLAAIAAARQKVDALQGRWDQLRAHVDRAAAARAELASAKDAAAAVMRSWAHQPHDGMPFIDTSDIERREFELTHYEREAEVSRSAQTVLAEHKTAATRELTALQRQLPILVQTILMEDAPNIREQLNAAIANANTLSARLFGLRSLLNDRGAHEQANEVSVCHEMWPAQAAILAAQTEWHAYAARLAANPEATMEN